MQTKQYQGMALRLARAAHGCSLAHLAQTADVSKFRLFEAEHNRVELSEAEVTKVSAVLPAFFVPQTPGSYSAVLEILKVVSHDPDATDGERVNMATFILKLIQAGRVAEVGKAMGTGDDFEKNLTHGNVKKA